VVVVIMKSFALFCSLIAFASFSFTTIREGGCMPAANFRLLISADQIKERVTQIADQLDHDYQNKEIVMIMIMKGAVCIASDLMRHIKTPCSLEYVHASSYGNSTSAGILTLTGLEKLDLSRKHILLVDDIYDTGATICEIKKQLLQKMPASLKTLVLLLKNKTRATAEIPDYILFTIDNKFVVGFGLDFNELYRGLPGIYAIN
jgi:hypoxanthine phosphoribosyltransferase